MKSIKGDEDKLHPFSLRLSDDEKVQLEKLAREKNLGPCTMARLLLMDAVMTNQNGDNTKKRKHYIEVAVKAKEFKQLGFTPFAELTTKILNQVISGKRKCVIITHFE